LLKPRKSETESATPTVSDFFLPASAELGGEGDATIGWNPAPGHFLYSRLKPRLQPTAVTDRGYNRPRPRSLSLIVAGIADPGRYFVSDL
jgi:hypothetical protein